MMGVLNKQHSVIVFHYKLKLGRRFTQLVWSSTKCQNVKMSLSICRYHDVKMSMYRSHKSVRPCFILQAFWNKALVHWNTASRYWIYPNQHRTDTDSTHSTGSKLGVSVSVVSTIAHFPKLVPNFGLGFVENSPLNLHGVWSLGGCFNLVELLAPVQCRASRWALGLSGYWSREDSRDADTNYCHRCLAQGRFERR